MRGKFVVGNWKMNGGLAANAALLAELAAGWKARARAARSRCVCRTRIWRRLGAALARDGRLRGARRT